MTMALSFVEVYRQVIREKTVPVNDCNRPETILTGVNSLYLWCTMHFDSSVGLTSDLKA